MLDPTINQPIERTLSEAMNGQEGLCVLSQVIVMRCRNGIDDYLFRRNQSFNALTWTPPSKTLPETINLFDTITGVRLPHALLPNFDNNGWPIDTTNIDVLDVSDYISGYSIDFDISAAAAATCSFQVANDGQLFSPENVLADISPDRVPTLMVYSGIQTPKNAVTGQPVIFLADKDPQDYKHKVYPNYMGLNGDVESPDRSAFRPMFDYNNIIKIREAYHNPNFVAGTLYSANDMTTWPLLWVDRFLGLISAASPAAAEGRPSLSVTAHDLMKMVAKGSTQRSYIPMMVTNDCDVSTGKPAVNDKPDPSEADFFDTNKVFYDPEQTSRAIEDIPRGLRAVNFSKVRPEYLSVGLDGKVALGLNQDWSTVPEPQISIAALPCTDAGVIAPNATPYRGLMVRWYDSYEPAGRPVRVERWDNLYMVMDRFFDPNSTIGATHPFISNYGNWSMVVDTEIDLANVCTGTYDNEMVLMALYVEGAAKVYWDGAEVGATGPETTLADFGNYVTRGGTPVPEIGYQSLKTNRAIVQPADPGVIAWTTSIYPKEGGQSTRFHRLKIVYQCGSHRGNRNILALRWWGRTDAQRLGLLQNASSLEGSATIRVKDDNNGVGTDVARYRVNFRNGIGDKLWFTNNTVEDLDSANYRYKDGDTTNNQFGYISHSVFYKKADPYYTDRGDGVALPHPFNLPAGSPPKSSLNVLNDTTGNDTGVDAYPVATNEQWVPAYSTNFTMASNAFISGEDVGAYIIVETDQTSQDKKFWFHHKSQSPDPTWYDHKIALHYRLPVVGEKAPVGMFRCKVDVTKDDPDWGYQVLYSRGGIEFNQPAVGMGQILVDDKNATLYYTFQPLAKYVYKFQNASLKVDDILSDIIIEDGFGVERFTSSFANATVNTPAQEYPLYQMFRYGWWEQHDGTGALINFGPLDSQGSATMACLDPYVPGAGPFTFFRPKVALGQVQRVPDTLMFNLSNTASSHDAIRKMLDLLRSNYYLHANEEGMVRGRYLQQSGLPRLIPPSPGAVNTNLMDREFYCMTAVGRNMALDLPIDNPSLGPLVTQRETSFVGEVMLDREVYGGNPYPSDTAVLRPGLDRDYRTLIFEPVFLDTDDADPNSVSVSPRTLSVRDKIDHYKIYRRLWAQAPEDSARFRWIWYSATITANTDGTPVAPGTGSYDSNASIQGYRKFWSDHVEKQAATYRVFWVIQPDKLTWDFDVAPPPTTNYDPQDLAQERLKSTDSLIGAKVVRPLMIGYDYKLDMMTSLSFPRDDFDGVTQVQVLGTRNAYSNPDLVAAPDTRVIFTEDPSGSYANNQYLPPRFRGPGLNSGKLVKDALSQTSFNAGSTGGFNIGWHLNTSASTIVNSMSTVFIVDEPQANHGGPSGTPALGSDQWPGGPDGQGWPGSWDAPTATGFWGSPQPIPFTDIKLDPRDTTGPMGAGGRSYSGSGWPLIESYITARFEVPYDPENASDKQWGFFAPEGNAVGVTLDPGGAATIDRVIRDKVRGGYVQNVTFSFDGDKLKPTDTSVVTSGPKPPTSDYFELFTLDFRRTIEFGEVGMAVGYAPYKLDAFEPKEGRLSLGSEAKYFRWMIGTGTYMTVPFVANGTPPINVKLYNIVGLADPRDTTPQGANGGRGSDAARSTWYWAAGQGAPAYNNSSVSFWLTHENHQIRSVNGGAPQSEFTIQLEIGSLEDGLTRPSDGLPVNTEAIKWHTVVSEQRLITQAGFYKWGEEIFKNYPAKGRYLRVKARQVSPVQYMGFVTRNAVPEPITDRQPSPDETGIDVAGRISGETEGWGIARKSHTKVARGSYQLRVEEGYGYSPTNQVVNISWNGVRARNENVDITSAEVIANPELIYNFDLEDPDFGWAEGRRLEIDGKTAGVFIGNIYAQPGLLPAVDTITTSAHLRVQADRNIGNGEYWYAGCNFLPSIGIAVNNDPNQGIRYSPWFGALPPVYHRISFISIQKMYVLQKSDIKVSAVLRPDPSDHNTYKDARANEWYDPKVASAGLTALGKPKTAYKTVSMPKRSLARLDSQGLVHLEFNHRSIFRPDASSYTEGRALTTAWQVLQDKKTYRQGAQVNVAYFPELRVFQTALVDENCIKGGIFRTPGDSTSGLVAPFGRSMLIERLSISKNGPVPQSSVTLRDYFV